MKIQGQRLAAGVVIVSFALICAALAHLRTEAIESARRLTDSISQVVGEQTTRTMQTIDIRLMIATHELQELRAANALDQTTARAALRQQIKDLPFVRAFWVMDRDGVIVYDSDVGNIGISLAHRPYFQWHLQHPEGSVHIGPPVRSRSTGDWLVSVSRPMPAQAGRFDGIIVAAFEPHLFYKTWQSIDLGADSSVALLNRDGRLLVRNPPDEASMSRDFSRFPLFTDQLTKRSEGLFLSQSPIDSAARLTAFRVLPAYPELLVAVGSSYSGVLASWRRFASLTAIVWAISVAAALALYAQLQRQVERRRRLDERYMQLAYAMPQIVFTSDTVGNVQFINQRWSEATGRPAESAMGRGWLERVHPDDRGAAAKTLAAMSRGGVELHHEHRLLYADGAYRWQLLRAVPARDANGNLVGWHGTSTEIDQLRRAQDQLRTQAGMLSMAGHLARLGGWSIDVANERITWTDEAGAILDMPPGSTPPLDEVLKMLKPSSMESTVQAVRACMEHGTPFDVEVEMTTATGRTVWVRSIGRAVRDADGKVVGLEGAQQDITQRVQLVAQIRELNASLEEKVAQRTRELARQEALFRALAEQVPMPVWTTDLRGNLTFASRAWYELFGGEAPRWDDKRWLELLHPDDREMIDRNWADAWRGKRPYAGTRRLRAATGEWRTTSYAATPVKSEEGETLFWVGVDVDVTDMMANQVALKRATEQMRAFSYSVSHDLRSPLERIAAFAQLLESEIGGRPADRAMHYVARIRANAQEMSQLIDALLSLAHVAELDMARGPVNLSGLAAEILERLEVTQPHRPVRWSVTPGLVVTGDVRLMRSVMENLLDNAWKFTSKTEHAVIEVGGSQERGEYWVRDNGAGFDMAHADRLFETFHRLHRSDEFPGTGIGLATVARAVNRQGGSIWAQSEPDKGATFYFTMPGPKVN
ncbi:MAG TPA: PAS domain-containing protein [Ramlibacter sp.]|nr:PAS domain-containing protein [Ramlibacter sp.]